MQVTRKFAYVVPINIFHTYLLQQPKDLMSQCLCCSKHFWNPFSGLSLHVSEFLQSSVLGIAKSCMGPNLANMVGSSITILTFWPKTPIQQAHHEQGHCYDARSEHQTKVQVFYAEHVTLPKFPIFF